MWKVELGAKSQQIKYPSKKSKAGSPTVQATARLPCKPVVTGQLKTEAKTVGKSQRG